MKQLLFLFLISFSQLLKAQDTLGGDWINEKSAFYCPCYCFSPTGSLKMPWSILTPNPISLVEDKIKPIKENVENYIIERGGEEFFRKLKFCNVDVVYLDSISKFESKKPEVDISKCGQTKYYFRYIFEPTNDVKYKIGIATNYNGGVISKDLFPDKNFNLDFHNILSKKQIIKKIRRKKKIDRIEFYYNSATNKFYYSIRKKMQEYFFSSINNFFRSIIHPITHLNKPRGRFFHKVYVLDAVTGKFISKETFTVYRRHH